MKIIKIDPDNPSPEALAEAVGVIRQGGVVVFPTETVYGVAADAYSLEAVRRVYGAKRRPETQPLPVMVAKGELVNTVAADISSEAKKLIDRFFPGPLTLVLNRHPELPDIVTAGGETVGVRIPDHPVALLLLREFGGPIVATSANLHGGPEPKTAYEAASQIGDDVDLIIDSGEVRIGVASTIVDMTTRPPRILRSGALSKTTLEQEIGEVID